MNYVAWAVRARLPLSMWYKTFQTINWSLSTLALMFRTSRSRTECTSMGYGPQLRHRQCPSKVILSSARHWMEANSKQHVAHDSNNNNNEHNNNNLLN